MTFCIKINFNYWTVSAAIVEVTNDYCWCSKNDIKSNNQYHIMPVSEMKETD